MQGSVLAYPHPYVEGMVRQHDLREERCNKSIQARTQGSTRARGRETQACAALRPQIVKPVTSRSDIMVPLNSDQTAAYAKLLAGARDDGSAPSQQPVSCWSCKTALSSADAAAQGGDGNGSDALVLSSRSLMAVPDPADAALKSVLPSCPPCMLLFELCSSIGTSEPGGATPPVLFDRERWTRLSTILFADRPFDERRDRCPEIVYLPSVDEKDHALFRAPLLESEAWSGWHPWRTVGLAEYRAQWRRQRGLACVGGHHLLAVPMNCFHQAETLWRPEFVTVAGTAAAEGGGPADTRTHWQTATFVLCPRLLVLMGRRCAPEDFAAWCLRVLRVAGTTLASPPIKQPRGRLLLTGKYAESDGTDDRETVGSREWMRQRFTGRVGLDVDVEREAEALVATVVDPGQLTAYERAADTSRDLVDLFGGLAAGSLLPPPSSSSSPPRPTWGLRGAVALRRFALSERFVLGDADDSISVSLPPRAPDVLHQLLGPCTVLPDDVVDAQPLDASELLSALDRDAAAAQLLLPADGGGGERPLSLQLVDWLRVYVRGLKRSSATAELEQYSTELEAYDRARREQQAADALAPVQRRVELSQDRGVGGGSAMPRRSRKRKHAPSEEAAAASSSSELELLKRFNCPGHSLARVPRCRPSAESRPRGRWQKRPRQEGAAAAPGTSTVYLVGNKERRIVKIGQTEHASDRLDSVAICSGHWQVLALLEVSEVALLVPSERRLLASAGAWLPQLRPFNFREYFEIPQSLAVDSAWSKLVDSFRQTAIELGARGHLKVFAPETLPRAE